MNASSPRELRFNARKLGGSLGRHFAANVIGQFAPLRRGGDAVLCGGDFDGHDDASWHRSY
jgi:hypothetical protein